LAWVTIRRAGRGRGGATWGGEQGGAALGRDAEDGGDVDQRALGDRRLQVDVWPAHAPQQAVWVLEQLEARRTWDDIVAALAAGEFSAGGPRGRP